MDSLASPHFLSPGDTIGVFTPSSPGYRDNPGLFENGIRNLEKLGFQVKLGRLTQDRAQQGYRSGTPLERAQELMDLVRDPKVHGLMSTIGGSNSASLIPYLDFDIIRKAKKPLCGFSDVTSLHLAIMKFSGLQTIYGPSVMCWVGEWPDGIPESNQWFLDAVTSRRQQTRQVKAPRQWSNHARRWDNGDWKSIPRKWEENPGWRILHPGEVQAPILALNLNTLMSAAGTPYWPEFNGKLLLLEDMEASLSRTERHLRQLSLIGIFDKIRGLIFGKPEFYKGENAPFGYDDLILETVGSHNYPIISNFDCGHTVPMISVPQGSLVNLRADSQVNFSFMS